MTRLSLTLGQKTLLLIAVPIVFQLLFFAALLKVESDSEAETIAADQARAFTEQINKLQRDMYDVASTFASADFNTINRVDYLVAKEKIELDFRELRTCVVKPEERRIVDEVINSGEEALRTIDRGMKEDAAGMLPNKSEARSQVFRTLRRLLSGALSDTVLNMAKRERAYLDASPERQAKTRALARDILIGGVVVSILFSALLAVFITRSVIRRLNIISDNSFRLARGAQLNARMNGNDEITNLDNVFHSLADSLTEALRKERATVENARDVIFSLDAKGTFVAVSPAARKVLDFDPSELVGAKFVRLLEPQTSQSVLTELKAIMEGSSEEPIETRFVRKDNRPIDVVLSATWSHLEQSMFCIAHDVTERKNAERLRQEVVAMVSHDLKTPLSTVRSFLEMLEAGMFGALTERGKQLLTLAERSSGRMLTLIRDLLEIEKMESGMLQLTKEKLDVKDLFEQTMHGVSTTAADAGVILQAVPTEVTIYADSDRIIQILVNLVSNAVKFSPRGGTVRLSASVLPGFIEIKVADQGRGVPASMTKSIFERFKQVEKSDAKEKGGSGLGLAICKALVEMHGGDIGVDSTQGKGSIFSFRIPATAAGSAGAVGEKDFKTAQSA